MGSKGVVTATLIGKKNRSRLAARTTRGEKGSADYSLFIILRLKQVKTTGAGSKLLTIPWGGLQACHHHRTSYCEMQTVAAWLHPIDCLFLLAATDDFKLQVLLKRFYSSNA